MQHRKRWILRPGLLLLAGISVAAVPAEAVEWKLGADLSGGLMGSSTQLTWAAVGGPAIGSSAGSSSQLKIGFLQAGSTAVLDPTAPTTPVVTDDGQFTQAAGIRPRLAAASGGSQQSPNQQLWSVVGEPAAGRMAGPSYRVETGFLPAATASGFSQPSVLHARWSSSDPESGIAEFQYAVGTTPGGTEVVPWTSAGLDLGALISGLSLTNGIRYYISVRARNGAGQWSQIGVSDGITVDSTAPTTPVVTDDGVYATSATQLHATWTSSDAESGIAEYQYQIRRDSSIGAVVVDWTSAGTATELTHTGLLLAHGTRYFFSVKAKNGAGLWSAVQSSDGIFVDLNTPQISSVSPADGFSFTQGDSLVMTLTASDADGDPLQFRFLVGAQTVQDWAAAAQVTVNTATVPSGVKSLRMEVRDTFGATDGRTIEIYVFRKPREAKQ